MAVGRARTFLTFVYMVGGLAVCALVAPKALAQSSSVSAWNAADFRIWGFVPNWATQTQINNFSTNGSYEVRQSAGPDYPLAAHKVSHLVPFWIADGKQKINVYFTYQDNPVYTNPGARVVWGKLFKDEKLIPYLVSMSSHMGEETALADIILPDCPYLERWEPESMPNSLWVRPPSPSP